MPDGVPPPGGWGDHGEVNELARLARIFELELDCRSRQARRPAVGSDAKSGYAVFKRHGDKQRRTARLPSGVGRRTWGPSCLRGRFLNQLAGLEILDQLGDVLLQNGPLDLELPEQLLHDRV